MLTLQVATGLYSTLVLSPTDSAKRLPLQAETIRVDSQVSWREVSKGLSFLCLIFTEKAP